MKRVQDVIQPNEHNQSCGEAPWVLPAPGKKYAANKTPRQRQVSGQKHRQFPIAQEEIGTGKILSAQSNPCTQHRKLQKIFERINLIHFLRVGALSF